MGKLKSVASRIFRLRESPTRVIDVYLEEARRKGENVYLLSTGQPSMPPPRELREYVCKVLREESIKPHTYTPTEGYLELRELIAEDLERLGGPKIDPKNELIVTAGGDEALFIAIQALVEPGDEVIIHDPYYFQYPPMLEYVGARIRYVTTSPENNFQPDIEEIKNAINDKTKLIVVVTPDNPTGRIISRDSAKAIVDLAVDHGIYVLSDEAYKTIVYEGSHVFLACMPGGEEVVVVAESYSKDPGIPGWRLGYLYGPEHVIKASKLVSTIAIYNPPSIAQYGIMYYLRERLRDKFLPKVLNEYRKRRDAMLSALNNHLSEAKPFKPSGGMFIYTDISGLLKESKFRSSEELAEKLARELRIMTIPGTFFSSRGDKWLRLSFISETTERIEEAVRLIAECVAKS